MRINEYKYKANANLLRVVEDTHILKNKTDIIPIMIEMMISLSNANVLKTDYNNGAHTFGLVSGKGYSNRFVYTKNENQIISFNNPFNVTKTDEDNYNFIDSYSNLHLSLQNILILKRIYSKISPSFNSVYIYSFEEAFLEIFETDEREFSNIDVEKWWKLVFRLLCFEPGYIRFDNDPQRSSTNHPLNHLDINLENSLKIGLHTKLKTPSFIDILNKNGNIKFLEK